MHRTARQCNDLQRAARSPIAVWCALRGNLSRPRLPAACYCTINAPLLVELELQNLQAPSSATALSEIRWRLDRAFVSLGSTCRSRLVLDPRAFLAGSLGQAWHSLSARRRASSF
jgi:hypothetical protein